MNNTKRTPGKSAAKPRPGVLFVLFTECRTAYFPQPSVARRDSPTWGTIDKSIGEHRVRKSMKQRYYGFAAAPAPSQVLFTEQGMDLGTVSA